MAEETMTEEAVTEETGEKETEGASRPFSYHIFAWPFQIHEERGENQKGVSEKYLRELESIGWKRW